MKERKRKRKRKKKETKYEGKIEFVIRIFYLLMETVCP